MAPLTYTGQVSRQPERFATSTPAFPLAGYAGAPTSNEIRPPKFWKSDKAKSVQDLHPFAQPVAFGLRGGGHVSATNMSNVRVQQAPDVQMNHPNNSLFEPTPERNSFSQHDHHERLRTCNSSHVETKLDHTTNPESWHVWSIQVKAMLTGGGAGAAIGATSLAIPFITESMSAHAVSAMCAVLCGASLIAASPYISTVNPHALYFYLQSKCTQKTEMGIDKLKRELDEIKLGSDGTLYSRYERYFQRFQDKVTEITQYDPHYRTDLPKFKRDTVHGCNKVVPSFGSFIPDYARMELNHFKASVLFHLDQADQSSGGASVASGMSSWEPPTGNGAGSQMSWVEAAKKHGLESSSKCPLAAHERGKHTLKDCRSNGSCAACGVFGAGTLEPHKPNCTYQPGRQTGTSKATFTGACYKCKKIGHRSFECTTPSDQISTANANVQQATSDAIAEGIRRGVQEALAAKGNQSGMALGNVADTTSLHTPSSPKRKPKAGDTGRDTRGRQLIFGQNGAWGLFTALNMAMMDSGSDAVLISKTPDVHFSNWSMGEEHSGRDAVPMGLIEDQNEDVFTGIDFMETTDGLIERELIGQTRSEPALVCQSSINTTENGLIADSGATHLVFTSAWVNRNPGYFYDLPQSRAEQLPQRIRGMYGKPEPVVRWLGAFLPVWGTEGPVWIALTDILVSDHGNANLTSETSIVEQHQCTITQDPRGKRMTFQNGVEVELQQNNRLYFLPLADDLSEFPARPTAPVTWSSILPPPLRAEPGRECGTTVLIIESATGLTNVSVPTTEDIQGKPWFASWYKGTKEWYQRRFGVDTDPEYVEAAAAARMKDNQRDVDMHAYLGWSMPMNTLGSMFGFRSPKYLRWVARQLKIKVTGQDEINFDYLLGKARQKPDPPGTLTLVEPGYMLAIDPVALMHVCYGAISYVWIMVDPGSGYSRAPGSKTKTSLNAVRAVLDNARQSKRSPHDGTFYKRIQSDSDSIFEAPPYQDMLRATNAVETYSAPFHHRQNNRVESKVHEIFFSGLAMVIAASGANFGRDPFDFLDEAIAWSCFIGNLVPAHGSDDEIPPYTKEHGKPPPLHMVRAMWGQEVFVFTHKAVRGGKLHAHGTKAVFIGVSEKHQNCWKLYNKNTGRKIISADVYFGKPDVSSFRPILGSDVFEFTDWDRNMFDVAQLPESPAVDADFDMDADQYSTLTENVPMVGTNGTNECELHMDGFDSNAVKGSEEHISDGIPAGSPSTTPTPSVDVGDDDTGAVGDEAPETELTRVEIDSHATRVELDSHAISDDTLVIVPDTTEAVSDDTIVVGSDTAQADFGSTVAGRAEKLQCNFDVEQRHTDFGTVIFDDDQIEFVVDVTNDTNYDDVSGAVDFGVVFTPELVADADIDHTDFGIIDFADGNFGDVDFGTAADGDTTTATQTRSALAIAKRVAVLSTLAYASTFNVSSHVKWGSKEFMYELLSDDETLDLPLSIPARCYTQLDESAVNIPKWTDQLEECSVHTLGDVNSECGGDAMILYHNATDVSLHDAMVMTGLDPDEPQSIEAVHRLRNEHDKQGFLQAMAVEMDGHEANGTWVDCEGKCPLGVNILPTKLFFIKKPNADGSFKYKGRLVVKGFRQEGGVDFGKTESPVPGDTALNVFLIVCAGEDLDIVHIDISQAFISADIDRELYIRLPKGLGGAVKRLNKALYGLKQASRLFYQMLTETILSFDAQASTEKKRVLDKRAAAKAMNFGYVQSKTEPCLFNLVCDGNDGRPLLWSEQRNLDGTLMHHRLRLLCYVDDILLASTKGNPLTKLFVDHMKSTFKIKLDPLVWFLNCLVQRDRGKRTIWLSQQQHAERCVENVLGVTASKVNPNRLPWEPGYQPDSTGCATTLEEQQFMELEERTPNFRRSVAKHIWLLRTRPDLNFAISTLCKYMATPGPRHLRDLRKVAKYLAGHLNYGLIFAPTDYEVSAESDSDWGANKSDRRSHSGQVVRVGGSVAKAMAKGQKLTALSSMEAELVALTEAVKTTLYTRRMMVDYGYESRPSVIGVDNQSVLAVSESLMITWRNRHIPLRYFFVREHIGIDINLQYVRSNDNGSDNQTKMLGIESFERHRSGQVVIVPDMDFEATVPTFTN
jgi:hypothetical protein